MAATSRRRAPARIVARPSRSPCRARSSSPSPSRCAGMARILLVEDETHLAKGIQFNFEIEGHEVDVLGDGAQALDRLTSGRPDADFDLVILDVMLPGLDGFAVADR